MAFSFRILLEQIAMAMVQIEDGELRSERFTLKIAKIHDRKRKIASDLDKPIFEKIIYGFLFSVRSAIIGFPVGQTLLGSF
ncbi:hypothetical protein [Mucilaginibacter sp. SJ]|uniref:hypothetical protein n=1 Tax=Mucilaginibacter sp. SJ TaxID=3029053 RepID=UPI0023A964D7|nr:hypothetical protein [Mucilaginibacter sp. SJ]WEA00651.1 hypothetical protein MusilaSJ_24660 [Mucilaginibacter sp. SJ]